ncbi:MAG: response regulator [Myxococcota bacterium]
MEIVCIDDDPMILKLLTIALQRRLSASVLSFSNPRTALDELVDRDPPDLVVLDAMMPEVDGFDVCRALMRAWGVEQTCFIFLTAGGPGHQERALEVGAAAALSKPFQPNQLVREIARILEAEGEHGGTTG